MADQAFREPGGGASPAARTAVPLPERPVISRRGRPRIAFKEAVIFHGKLGGNAVLPSHGGRGLLFF